MAKAKVKKNVQDESDIEEDQFEAGSDDFTGNPANDEDVKYHIGTIVVDDGTAGYVEIEDEADVAAPASASAEDDTTPVDDNEDSVKDEFLDEANADLDDPERHWGT